MSGILRRSLRRCSVCSLSQHDRCATATLVLIRRPVIDRTCSRQRRGLFPIGRHSSVVAQPGNSSSPPAQPIDDKTAVDTSKGTDTRSRWWQLWKYRRVRLLVRAVRIGFLAFALYHMGVADGLQRYAADPEGERKKLIWKELKRAGAVEEFEKDGEVDTKPKVAAGDSTEVAAVRRVFPRILKAALEEIKCQEKAIKAAVKNQEESEDGCKKKLKELRRAKLQLRHWQPDGFLVMNVPSPNAFVTAMVPRMVFVHTGLFHTGGYVPVEDVSTLKVGQRLRVKLCKGEKYRFADKKNTISFKEGGNFACSFVRTQKGRKGVDAECVVKVKSSSKQSREICVEPKRLSYSWNYSVAENDEHLAMILAHELSHVVHGHSSASITLNAQALGLQMVILALLDPTGMLSLVFEACVGPMIRYGVILPHSREHELEADATGLRITARALYDPSETSAFFNRMLEYSEVTGSSCSSSWKSTHPRHEDRIKALEELEAEAMKLYEAKKQEAVAQGWKEAPEDLTHIAMESRQFLAGATLPLLVAAGALSILASAIMR